MLVLCEDIYIDPSYSGPELGTFERPFSSWAQISSFSPENDYRQKCGTVFTGTLNIKVSGSSSNPIIIGAYSDVNGTPVHEDDAPVIGSKSSTGKPKPVIKYTLGSGTLISTQSGGNQYLEINSIRLQNANCGISIQSNYNKIRFCDLFNMYWGIRVGLALKTNDGKGNLIEYNTINLNTPSDEGRLFVDAIQLNYRASGNTIQYNSITGFDHGGIFFYGADNNIARYNQIYSSGVRAEDFAFGHNYDADSNNIYQNVIENAGMAYMIFGGNNNKFSNNDCSCDHPTTPSAYQGCIQIEAITGANSNGNIISNYIITVRNC